MSDETSEVELVERAKGEKWGECNRTGCTNAPAEWFNAATRFWYCQSCAERINTFNREDICVRKDHG